MNCEGEKEREMGRAGDSKGYEGQMGILEEGADGKVAWGGVPGKKRRTGEQPFSSLLGASGPSSQGEMS